MADNDVNVVAELARKFQSVPEVREFFSNTRLGKEFVAEQLGSLTTEQIGSFATEALDLFNPANIVPALASNDPLTQSLAGVGAGIPIIKPISKVANPFLRLLGRGGTAAEDVTRASKKALETQRKAKFAGEATGEAAPAGAVREGAELASRTEQAALKGAFSPDELVNVQLHADVLPLDEIARNPQAFRQSSLGQAILRGETPELKAFEAGLSEFRTGAQAAAKTAGEAIETAATKAGGEIPVSPTELVADVPAGAATTGAGFLAQAAQRPIRTATAAGTAALAPGVGKIIGENQSVQDLLSRTFVEPGLATGEILGLADPATRAALENERNTRLALEAEQSQADIQAGAAGIETDLDNISTVIPQGAEIIADLSRQPATAPVATGPSEQDQILALVREALGDTRDFRSQLTDVLRPQPVQEQQLNPLQRVASFVNQLTDPRTVDQRTRDTLQLEDLGQKFTPRQELASQLLTAQTPAAIGPLDVANLLATLNKQRQGGAESAANIELIKARTGLTGAQTTAIQEDPLTEILRRTLAPQVQ